MNSDKIYQLLQEIANIGSTKEKTKIVTENIHDLDFQNVLSYALDPTKIYGIVPSLQWQEINSPGTKEFDFTTIELIKSLSNRELTGHDARDALLAELSELTPNSANLLVNIIKKDLRAGFGISITNKAKSGLIPVYPYMRCEQRKSAKFNKFNFKNGVYSQHKADGLYANGNITDTLNFVSRQGSEFPMDEFSDIINDLKHIKERQLHGELLVLRDGVILDRNTGNGILNSISSGGKFAENEKPLYVCWDTIPLSEAKSKNKYKVPYCERLALLEDLLKDCSHVKVIDYEIFHTLEECYEHAKALIKSGKEGTVIKDPDMIWEDGTNKYQVKVKVEFNCDLIITGIGLGREGTKTEGRAATLSCKTSDNLLSVNVTVKNEKMRDAIDANPDEWIGKIATVIANDISLDSSGKKVYSLSLPRFAEDNYRTDKTEADTFKQCEISLQSCME